MFVGREHELTLLMERLSHENSSLVLCRGRRRIGKSRLIAHFGASAERFLRFQGLPPREGTSARHQLDAFAHDLSEQTPVPKLRLDSWPQAFSLLASQLDDRPTVILLDEISWMSKGTPDFSGFLKNAWDTEFSRRRTCVLVLCGSVSSWIQRNILNNTGFVGRVALNLTLGPLELAHCNRFWGEAAGRISSREKLELLSVMGGVPRYLEEISQHEPASQTIRRLCFSKEGLLFSEYESIWSDLFSRRGPRYRAIVEALIDGPRTLGELAAVLDRQRSGRLIRYLDDLALSGFVCREVSHRIGSGTSVRPHRYRLVDPYLRFYLKYIEPRKEAITGDRLRDSALEHVMNWDAILGIQFETLILNNVNPLCRRLGLDPAILLSAGPHIQRRTARQEACQIDLLLQTRHAAWVCEIKCRDRIGLDVATEVKEKVRKMKWRRGTSVRTALVHEGAVTDELRREGFFDRFVSFEELLQG